MPHRLLHYLGVRAGHRQPCATSVPQALYADRKSVAAIARTVALSRPTIYSVLYGATKPGIQSVVRLMQYCEQNRADPGELSDEELEQTIMDHTKHLIRHHPELAIAAADECGWTVISRE